MKKVIFFLGIFFLFFITNQSTFAQCITADNTYVDLNNAGGAPCSADGVTACTTTDPDYTAGGIGVFGSEAYLLDNVVAGGSYTFDMCAGVGIGAWIPEVTILAPDGTTVDAWNGGPATGSTAAFVDQCSLTWTASQSGTYSIIINELGTFSGDAPTQTACTATLAVDNGNPTVSCAAGSLPACPGCSADATWVDLAAGTTAAAPALLCNATNDTIFVGVGDLGLATNISTDFGALPNGAALPAATAGVIAYTNAELAAAAGGMDNIILTDQADPTCADTLVLDLAGITDVTAFCTACTVSSTWVDFDATGAPILSAIPVPFCSANGDSLQLLIAGLGNAAAYDLSSTAGTLDSAFVTAGFITGINFSQADLDALDIGNCGMGDGIVTITLTAQGDPTCTEDLVVDLSTIPNAMVACTGMGCTDATACNFDANATTDDGSCILPQAGCDCCGVTPIGGTLATTDPTTICAGDGVPDPINTTLMGNVGTNSAYVITDAAGMILDLPAGPPFDLEGAGAGTCLIWHLSFEDGLTGAAIGNNATTDLVGCYSLSNEITVVRELAGCTDATAANYDPAAQCDDGSCMTACDVDGGTLSTTDPTTICAGDGVADPIMTTLVGNMGTNTQYVITDAAGTILDLPAGPPFDLEGAGAGTCLIWHLSFEDGLTGAAVGNNANTDLVGCYDLSNAITVIRQESGVDCNVVSGNACPLDTPFAIEDNPPILSVDCMGDPFIETINGCNYAEEYATINNLIDGEMYCFSTENGVGDYVSIYDDLAGTALADGPADGTVCVAGPAGGTLYMQINLNDGACGTEETCRDSFVSCPSCPAPTPGCTNAVADNYDPAAVCDDGSCIVTNTACPLGVSFGTESTPPTVSGCNGTPTLESITTANFAGEYATINNLIPGETYCFSTDEGAGDYVTLYDDVAGAPLADGPADGTTCVVATATGTIYMQITLNDMACSSESVTRESFVSCQTCPAPPSGCTNPCADNYDAAALCDDGSCTGAALPTNDFCSTAISLTLETPVSGNTDCSTLDPIASNLVTCGTTLTAQGNWYTITGNGLDYTASMCGSAFDTKIHVFTGDCTDATTLTCVDANDDAFGVCSPQSEISFPTTNGQDYYIYASGFGANTGNYNLVVSDDCVLTNGDCLTVARVCDGNALYVQCFNAAYTYTWTNQDTGASTTITGTPYFSPTETGTYYVTITDAANSFTANGTCSTLTVETIIDCSSCGE